MEFLYSAVCFVQKVCLILFLLLLVSSFAKSVLFFCTFNCYFQMLDSIWTYRCFNTFFFLESIWPSLFSVHFYSLFDAVFNFQLPFQLVWTAYLPSFPFIVPSTISKAWHNRKAFGELIHLWTFSVILVLWFQSLSHGIYYNGIFQTTLATCVSN